MEQFISTLSNIVWGPPVLVLLIGTGLFLTIMLKGLQFTRLPYALKLAFSKHQDNNSKGDISHFQALMTAPAATVKLPVPTRLRVLRVMGAEPGL